MIDTLGLIAEGEIKQKQIDLIKANPFFSKTNEYGVTMKANKNTLSTVEETLKAKESIDNIYPHRIKRLDLACDFTSKLEDNIELYKLFLGCLNQVRGNSLSLSITNFEKEKEKKGNLKIKKSFKETTFYNCDDKERFNSLGEVIYCRFENRILNIRNSKPDREKITSEIKLLISEIRAIKTNLNSSDSYFLREVEDFYINLIAETYSKKKETYLKIQEFIRVVEEKEQILTKRILEESLKKCGYTHNTDKFIKRFKKARGNGNFKFVFKKDLIKLCDILIENFEKSLEN